MQRLKVIIALFLLLVIVITCKKDDPGYPFEQEQIVREGLTKQQDSVIAAQPSKTIKPSDVVFEDGETLENFILRTNPLLLNTWGKRLKTNSTENARLVGADVYKQFVEDLFAEGARLSNTANFDKKEELPVKATVTIDDITRTATFQQPMQKGLAYVYNGDPDIDHRKAAGFCDLMLFGTDCSGMTTLMFNKAGVYFPEKYNAANFAKEDLINVALNYATKLKDLDLEYVDRGPMPFNQVKNGDIIYFKTGNGITHLGIALTFLPPSPIHVFQSNGRSHPDNGDGCEKWQNEKGRGPHAVAIGTIVSWFTGWGVLHLEPKKIDPKLLAKWRIIEWTATQTRDGKFIAVFRLDEKEEHLEFFANNTYRYSTGLPDPYSCDGVYVTYGPNKNLMRLAGCDVQDVDALTITSLTDIEMTLLFKGTKKGIVETHILKLKKEF